MNDQNPKSEGDDRKHQADCEIEEMLLESIEGPFTDWTNGDIDEIRHFGTEVINRRKQAGC
jgi:hypothetical protein